MPWRASVAAFPPCPRLPSIARCSSSRRSRRSVWGCADSGRSAGPTSRRPIAPRWPSRSPTLIPCSPWAGVGDPRRPPRSRRAVHPRFRRAERSRARRLSRRPTGLAWTSTSRTPRRSRRCPASVPRSPRASSPTGRRADRSAHSPPWSACAASVPHSRVGCNHMSRFRFRLVLRTRSIPLLWGVVVLDTVASRRTPSRLSAPTTRARRAGCRRTAFTRVHGLCSDRRY